MATQMRRDPNRDGIRTQYMQYPAGAGETFFVNRASEGGDDGNDGRTIESALLSITEALDRCTGGRNDYIFVNRVDSATETWPIEITKSYVHIIGQPHQATPTALIAPDSDAHGFDITAGGGVEIAGFLFGSDKSWTKAGINSTAAVWMNHFHHNFFAWTTEMHDCILEYGSGSSCRINNNFFGAHGFDGTAIWTDNQYGRVLVEDNVIMVKGVEMDGEYGVRIGGHGSVVINNVFTVPDAANGEAIWQSGVGRGVIAGNSASNGGVALDFNPYRDTAPTPSNWGINYAGIAPTLPITV